MNFDTLLKEMADKRIAERERYYRSSQSEIDDILIDFKCWAYSKGKFYNLDEKLFNAYKTETKTKISFDLNMAIFQKCFGYKFDYDSLNSKWRTTKKGDRVINYAKVR